MIVDYHMHLRDQPEDVPDAHYSRARAELYVEQATRAAVDEIGFTEHIHLFRQLRGRWPVRWLNNNAFDDLDEYVMAVIDAKEAGLPVKLGIEVDFFPELADELASVLAPYPWDFLLGSVHFAGGFGIDMRPSLVEAVGPAAAAATYYEQVRGAVRSGLVDVLAHVDLIKFFGDVGEDDYPRGTYERLVHDCAETGVAIEISTAGLRKPHGRLYPEPRLLELARAAGVPITFASDAHQPEDVGRHFGVAVSAATGAGFDTVTVFDRRKPRQLRLSRASNT
jgi:histidinol-phosphatase (PHP family)